MVTAPTLKEAYRKVRLLHGKDAVISGTRTVTVAGQDGLGQRKLVEVMVGNSAPAAIGYGRPDGRPALAARVSREQPDDVMRELDRIDALVREVTTELAALAAEGTGDDLPPGFRALGEAGTGDDTLRRLRQRFEAAGSGSFDPAGLRSWLAGQVRAADCDWDGFFGSHAFLGTDRSLRQDLVLATCGRFRELDRKLLLLVAFPQHEGVTARIQQDAARHGYDAAVIRRPEQLLTCEKHFADYDAVLLEMPDLDDPQLMENSAVRAWLADNPAFHRHLVVSLAADLASQPGAASVLREWNCDWLGIMQPEDFSRPGKLLDLIESMPLPVSLVGRRQPGGGCRVGIADSGELVAALLPAPESGAGMTTAGGGE